MIRGAFAAALTPLRDGGAALDEDAFEPYVDFLADGRRRRDPRARDDGRGDPAHARPSAGAAPSSSSRPPAGGSPVAVHCGAQTTAETAALAAHAAEAGADAVAVIAPPYFPLDEAALEEHFAAAAAACAPLPFYVYEFAGAQRLRGAGRGRSSGCASARRTCAGSRSPTSPGRRSSRTCSTASTSSSAPSRSSRAGSRPAPPARSRASLGVFPEVVAALVREPTQERSDEAERLRAELDRFPFQAAAKAVAARRGVPIGPDVRAPLRGARRRRARASSTLP